MPEQPKSDLVTEDPPARVLAYDWPAIAEQLRAEPGVWKKVYEQDRTTYAVAIRNGKIASLRQEDGFEVYTANNTRGRNIRANGDDDPGEPRKCSLYLRWVKSKKRTTTQKEAK